MSSWSKRRKNLYVTVIVILLVGVVGVPAFFTFYKAPTCFDGVKNGNELGVDCGGSCQKLCPSAFIPPIVSWKRTEQVAPGVYNLAAYIINQNTDGGAHNVPYHIVLYDGHGIPIADAKGTVTLPPHRNTLAFIPAVKTSKAIPVASFFEFTAIPDWNKEADTLAPLVIGTKVYSEDTSGSYLQVELKNPTAQPFEHVSVYAVLYDGQKNAVGFSKTIVDEIPAGGSTISPFTWPESHNGQVISEEVLPVAE